MSELSKLEITQQPPGNPIVKKYRELYDQAKFDLNRAIEELEKMEELTK